LIEKKTRTQAEYTEISELRPILKCDDQSKTIPDEEYKEECRRSYWIDNKKIFNRSKSLPAKELYKIDGKMIKRKEKKSIQETLGGLSGNIKFNLKEQEEGSEQKGTYDAHRRPMNSILKVPTPWCRGCESEESKSEDNERKPKSLNNFNIKNIDGKMIRKTYRSLRPKGNSRINTIGICESRRIKFNLLITKLKIHTPPDLSLNNSQPQPILKNVKKHQKQVQEESKEENIGIEMIPPK